VERLKQRLATTRGALVSLEEALAATPRSDLERDGCIQRFEYTFESFWKLCQRYLAVVEGMDCASPKSCLRGIGEVGVLDATDVATTLVMTDDRNQTVHLYREDVAAKIFARLPDYAHLMRRATGILAARCA